jgi:CheY-like chemotaxis protein
MPEKTDTRFVARSTRHKRAAPPASGPILIVDDNPDDAKLAERAFLQLNPDLPLIVFSSGRELIDHLEGKGKQVPANAAAPTSPLAILLDLNMPEMDGLAVLEWCAKQPEAISNIPIIVQTNFTDLPHMKRAYALGARSYLLKPIDLNALRSVLSSLSISV